MMFLVECDIFVPIPPFHLTIIVRCLQLSFCIYGMLGHMIRAEKKLVDVKEYSSTILCTLPLFYIAIFVSVCEHL